MVVQDSGEDSQQPSIEPASRSQSPVSYVVELNEDSECSLQSLPPGEHGPTNFSMKLSGLVTSGESFLTDVMPAEYLEDDSRCSQYSERVNDGPDLLMEVETGSWDIFHETRNNLNTSLFYCSIVILLYTAPRLWYTLRTLMLNVLRAQ